MPEIQSPCLSCELKDSSKDNSTCIKCDARWEYAKLTSGAISFEPGESVVRRRTPVIDLKKAELYIQKICEKHSIKIEDLRGRRRSGGLGDIRKEVIHTLYSEYKLLQSDIGKLLARSNQSISIMMKTTDVKPTKTVDETSADITLPEGSISTQTVSAEESTLPLTRNPSGGLNVGAADDLHGCHKPDQPEKKPDLSHITKKDTESPDMKVVCFSFRDHPDLHNYLLKTAKANFRKPEDHILYLINKEKEGSHEYKNVFQSSGTI